MKDTQDVQSASECASPVPDVGDGRETTRCGSLQVGVTVSGILSSTLEAHNWLFDSQTGPMEISIENDEKSCPHIMVLDTSGKIVDGFEDENDLRLCVSGLTTTGLYHFVPPASGIYIIRVYSPDSSGEYWLEIK